MVIFHCYVSSPENRSRDWRLYIFPTTRGSTITQRSFVVGEKLHAIEPFLVAVNIQACHIEMVPIFVNALQIIVNIPVLRIILYMHIFIIIHIYTCT